MRSPLTVRIADGVRDQQVTRYVKALRFTKTAPGGHHSASVTIDAPDRLFSDLGPADRVYIYDGRNARSVWDGYVENPGRVTVAGGASYNVSAMGGVALASDNARSVVFRSTDISGAHWQRYEGSHPDATIEVDEAIVPGTTSIKTLVPHGIVSPGVGGVKASAQTINVALAETGQTLYSATVTVRGGRDDVSGDVDAAAMVLSDGVAVDFEWLSTTDKALSVSTAGTSYVTLGIQLTPDVAFDVPESTWAAFRNFVLTPALLTASGGTAVPASAATVLAHEVAHHVVGALMPQIDGTTAYIESSTFPIENLSYLGAVKPYQILDDLGLYEPDYLWEILGSVSSGKHRFAYRKWPTTPRYEISGGEFTETGGEVDLCNRIVVSWKDTTGADRTTIRTASVPALGSRVRDADPIALPDGQGSEANAEHIGDQVLAALNTPTRSGTAVVRKPILDRLSGMMVAPWEIEPGYLVRVRDRGLDLRLTEMTYEDSDCSASLSLGSPTLTLPQRLARLRESAPGRRWR